MGNYKLKSLNPAMLQEFINSKYKNGYTKHSTARFPKEYSFYIPLQVAFNTGMRASEVCGLTWDNIDFKNKTITVEKITAKKGLKWCFGTPVQHVLFLLVIL